MTTPPPEYLPPLGGDGLAYPMNDEDKTYGMIAHGGAIIFGFLAPLFVLLFKKDSAFAQQEAKEALNFQIWILIGVLISVALMFIVIGFCVIFAVILSAVYYEVNALIRVNNGIPYRYPYNVRIIK